jgi:dTDP-4-dehydrorhamnose 3,5-epimerase
VLPDARKDPRLISSSWEKATPRIDGLVVHEVKHVPGDRGVLTEVWRSEWGPVDLPVGQVFQVRLFPGRVSAWHCHVHATDRLFVATGHAKVVCYDERGGSPTRGALAEFHVGESRPTLVVVPPGVWHGVQNVGASDALILNCPSSPYEYDDPDHWRVAADTPHIPYSWTPGAKDA